MHNLKPLSQTSVLEAFCSNALQDTQEFLAGFKWKIFEHLPHTHNLTQGAYYPKVEGIFWWCPAPKWWWDQDDYPWVGYWLSSMRRVYKFLFHIITDVWISWRLRKKTPLECRLLYIHYSLNNYIKKKPLSFWMALIYYITFKQLQYYNC